MKKRCEWCLGHDIYIDYHDNEWGVPLHDEQALFEFLILEGMQAGLSWLTILKKRENYRLAFDHFQPEKIACYSDKKIAKLLQNPGIIRNRLKVNAIRSNAQALLNLREQGIVFSDFVWQFTEGRVLQNQWRSISDNPASTDISDKMSRELKRHGFKFVGSTICYAFMQATGMVNDHVVSCFRHQQVKDMSST